MCLWLDFSVKIILSILSDFLWPEKLTQKKVSNFTKLWLFHDKIDQNTNFGKLPSAKEFFLYKCKICHSRIEDKKIAQCFVSVSLASENLRGFREFILQKNPALHAQIREQMSGPDLHVFTLKVLALKKLVFPGRHGILIFSCLLFVLFDFFFQITESWLKPVCFESTTMAIFGSVCPFKYTWGN